jgi:hypothetical protein
MHNRARQDLRTTVDKYPPLAGAGNELALNQTKLLCSDALDSALATRNEHDFQPDTPVDGRAEASPGGTRWSEVAATMRSDDIDQKETTRLGRATEKAEAMRLTEPRPGTEWLDQFSIDEEKKKRAAKKERKRATRELNSDGVEPGVK